MSKSFLTWTDIDRDCKKLVSKLNGREFDTIVGIETVV